MHDHATKVADAAVPLSWLAWFLSHMQEINQVLQLFLLVCSIVASLCAARYHWKKARALGRHK